MSSLPSVLNDRYYKVKIRKVVKLMPISEYMENGEISDVFTSFMKDVQLMKNLDHPNIVKLFDIFEVKQGMVVVEEYCDAGSLYDFLTKVEKFEITHVRQLFQQIFEGLAYLHTCCKIAHRNLKPENILLHKTTVKLTEFGCSIDTDRSLRESFVGSSHYIAPEIVRGKMYDGSIADIWSLGCVLYVLACGHLPFEGVKNFEILQKIAKGKYHPLPLTMDENCKDLIRKMLCVNEKQRITIDGIRNHPFYKKDLPRPFIRNKTEIRDSVISKMMKLNFGPKKSSNDDDVTSLKTPPKTHMMKRSKSLNIEALRDQRRRAGVGGGGGSLSPKESGGSVISAYFMLMRSKVSNGLSEHYEDEYSLNFNTSFSYLYNQRSRSRIFCDNPATTPGSLKLNNDFLSSRESLSLSISSLPKKKEKKKKKKKKLSSDDSQDEEEEEEEENNNNNNNEQREGLIRIVTLADDLLINEMSNNNKTKTTQNPVLPSPNISRSKEEEEEEESEEGEIKKKKKKLVDWRKKKFAPPKNVKFVGSEEESSEENTKDLQWSTPITVVKATSLEDKFEVKGDEITIIKDVEKEKKKKEEEERKKRRKKKEELKKMRKENMSKISRTRMNTKLRSVQSSDSLFSPLLVRPIDIILQKEETRKGQKNKKKNIRNSKKKKTKKKIRMNNKKKKIGMKKSTSYSFGSHGLGSTSSSVRKNKNTKKKKKKSSLSINSSGGGGGLKKKKKMMKKKKTTSTVKKKKKTKIGNSVSGGNIKGKKKMVKKNIK